jgi:hypothetical protein
MNLSKLTALIQKYLRVFQYGDRVKPVRDWFLMVSIAGILLLGSAGWSYWLFEQTSNAKDAQLKLPPSSMKTASVETVRTIFDARAALRAHYLSDYHFVDPSR